MLSVTSPLPIANNDSTDNLNDSLLDNKPADAASSNSSSGLISIFTAFTGYLFDSLTNFSGQLGSLYQDISGKNTDINQLKQAYDELVRNVNAQTVLWEGPQAINWPTDVDQAIDATKRLDAALSSTGKTLDPLLKDKLAYINDAGTRIVLDTSAVFGGGVPANYDRNQMLKGDIFHQYSNWSDAALIAANWGVPSYAKFQDGKIYRIDYGKDGFAYKAEVKEFVSDSSRLGLALYGDRYLVETKRLEDAGIPIAQYDAYQYTTDGKVDYTTVNQILARDSTDFSGVANGTIVAVGKDYYLVNAGKGQKLDGAPAGLLMGLPSSLSPQGDVRYRNAIVATVDLLQRDRGVQTGDLDMAMFSYGGGQVGYAKLPPVVTSSDPQKSNTPPLSYPPGTLLQYTEGQNVSYYLVTGTGVAKVEDPGAIAKTVKGNPPDLSAIDAGTVVKLDDGKLYWVTEDKKTVAAEGAPLLRFMSPERKAIWDGIDTTEGLERLGLDILSKDMDSCRFLDKNGEVVIAKLPAKVFDGPGTEPSGKDYAPGDVVKSRDGTRAWYIDAQGKAQEARSCIKVRETVERAKDFDPSKYAPGDVVGVKEDGKYYRITEDHKKVEISYPLQEFIANPSADQIASLQSKLRNLMNAKGADANNLMIKVQMVMGKQNILWQMITTIVNSLGDTSKGVVRNIA